jgi:small conductance mechanosensitive channel
MRPLRIGEYVEVGSITGTVEEIGLFATRLRAADGIYVLAPNSTLWTQPVKNFTRNGVRRNDITITVSNTDDIDRVQKSLLGLVEHDARVKKEPAPTAFVAELGDSTVAITLRYWTSVGDFLPAKVELNKGVRNTLNANN